MAVRVLAERILEHYESHRAKLDREKETRHWTNEQWRQAYGVNWPSVSATTRIEADVAGRELAAAAPALARAYLEAEERIDRLIEAGVERWHTVVNDEPALHAWLGLTRDEYKAWVERTDFAFLAEHERLIDAGHLEAAKETARQFAQAALSALDEQALSEGDERKMVEGAVPAAQAGNTAAPSSPSESAAYTLDTHADFDAKFGPALDEQEPR